MEKCQKGVIQQDLEVFPSNKGLLLTHTLTVLCMTSLGDNVKSLNVTVLEQNLDQSALPAPPPSETQN